MSHRLEGRMSNFAGLFGYAFPANRYKDMCGWGRKTLSKRESKKL